MTGFFCKTCTFYPFLTHFIHFNDPDATNFIKRVEQKNGVRTFKVTYICGHLLMPNMLKRTFSCLEKAEKSFYANGF